MFLQVFDHHFTFRKVSLDRLERFSGQAQINGLVGAHMKYVCVFSQDVDGGFGAIGTEEIERGRERYSELM